ncbi:hypothetical protein QBC34DRAFT_38360 [Podospora aff. communis PSN243]|uniref:Chitin synthase regulatory factor n=1 Tax=Podospora aff. communis PSN243 TaxID=3040156 RepID=A0AAV9GT31_9PEZI|nr:hypothetical protein QBC34DRAFT_38360 [Podospora aff. communis PSN243]
MPRLGATFVPGGFDDYYQPPEVVAPAPQRVMPEVPQNMQNDLQRLEHEARGTEQRPPLHANQSGSYGGESNFFKPFHSSGAGTAVMDVPSFSPFPKVKGENIPPSDEEKEEILWQARDSVLHSNNVSMQIIWARDTLIWVETAQDVAARDWKREGRGRERPPTPKIEHQLRVDAVNILDYLASQDHPEACFMKGKWLEFGKFGQRENKREAYSYFKKAADNGYGRAEYRMGMLYEHSNDITNALKHYQIGVSLGDSASNYRLGMIHLMGQHGFQKDVLQGLDMIQKAADTSDEDAPQGAFVYGMLIARELPDIDIPERILPFDQTVARQYIEKAAYLCFAKAQLKMGQAYELSQLGCDFNPAYSLHYYGLAARQGSPEASLGVSRWFLFGYENVFAKNEQLAFKYAQDAADAGLATGEFAMGYYHEIGIHVKKDLQEARRWYELAAEHGNKDAKERVESLSQSKALTKKDHETTTLTRLKSQHGSQRGKRPDRFARPNEAMPTLVESGASTPVGMGPGPRKSPRGSPMHQPTIVEDAVDFPDPAWKGNGGRPPAFTLNLDHSAPAGRPQSAAPYPQDDRPQPLTLRPKSTAPYPEDDRPPLSPHYHPNIRPSAGSGPAADRPLSAFGIRPVSSHGPAPHGGPPQPQLGAGRCRPPTVQPVGWEPQVPSGYRQPSPAGGRPDPNPQWSPPPQQQGYADLPSQRLGPNNVGPGATVPGGPAPVGDPARARLQKTNPNFANPNLNKPQPVPQGQPRPFSTVEPGAGAQYGPRTSSRPVSENLNNYNAGPGGPRPGATSTTSLPPGGGHAHPGHGRLPSGGGGASLKPRPGLEMSGGRASAPPSQIRPVSSHGAGGHSPGPNLPGPTNPPAHGGRPGGGSATSPAGSAHPDGKTMGQGPATFEAMGIPQGKNESDCVVM